MYANRTPSNQGGKPEQHTGVSLREGEANAVEFYASLVLHLSRFSLRVLSAPAFESSPISARAGGRAGSRSQEMFSRDSGWMFSSPARSSRVISPV